MAESSAISPAPVSGAMAPGGSLAPFRYPAFRAIWVANLFSQLGSLIQSIGAAWLMTDLTTSHRFIAAVQASNTLPIMLLGVFAGAIADNFDRRRVMLAAQVGMLVVSAVLAVLTFKGLIGPWSLVGFTLAVGAGTALNSPAWQASVRAQVGPRDVPQAISLNTISFNLARSVGPALGGILISISGVGAAFAINAISYIAMVWVLFRWKPEVPAPTRRPMLPSIGTGLSFCFGSAPVRRVLIKGAGIGFGTAAYSSLLPAVVRGQIHGSEFQFGLLLGVFGIGSILAAIAVAPARRRFGTEWVVTFGALTYVVALTLLSILTSVWGCLPVAFVAGMGWVLCLTTLNVAMQVRSPEAIIGRCMSIYQAATYGAMALGAWTWGAVADAASLHVALRAAAGFLVVALIVLRFVARMPGPGEGRVDLG